jgi:hypothetical protein
MKSVTRSSGDVYPYRQVTRGETFPIDALSLMPKYPGEGKVA